MILLYKAMNLIFTTLYGIFTESLSAKFSRARFSLVGHQEGVIDDIIIRGLGTSNWTY